MATGAMQAVVNEQQKIIFKGALKINCAVLLTQSPNCCMVNFKHVHFTAVQLVFDERFLMDSKLHFRCCLRVQASNYILSHMYETHLQLLSASWIHSKAETGKNIDHTRKKQIVYSFSVFIFFKWYNTVFDLFCVECNLLSFIQILVWWDFFLCLLPVKHDETPVQCRRSYS